MQGSCFTVARTCFSRGLEHAFLAGIQRSSRLPLAQKLEPAQAMSLLTLLLATARRWVSRFLSWVYNSHPARCSQSLAL
jgi:hypothetical protein